MSKRRKAGDWVWLSPGAGMVGESWKWKVEILPPTGGDEEDEEPSPCFLCDDPDCIEWEDVETEADAQGDRYYLYHVSECTMYDTQQQP